MTYLLAVSAVMSAPAMPAAPKLAWYSVSLGGAAWARKANGRAKPADPNRFRAWRRVMRVMAWLRRPGGGGSARVATAGKSGLSSASILFRGAAFRQPRSAQRPRQVAR